MTTLQLPPPPPLPSFFLLLCVRACVRVCVCARARVCVCAFACVRVCVRAFVRVFVRLSHWFSSCLQTELCTASLYARARVFFFLSPFSRWTCSLLGPSPLPRLDLILTRRSPSVPLFSGTRPHHRTLAGPTHLLPEQGFIGPEVRSPTACCRREVHYAEKRTEHSLVAKRAERRAKTDEGCRGKGEERRLISKRKEEEEEEQVQEGGGGGGGAAGGAGGAGGRSRSVGRPKRQKMAET